MEKQIIFGFNTEQPIPQALPGIEASAYELLTTTERTRRWVDFLNNDNWTSTDFLQRSVSQLDYLHALDDLFRAEEGTFTNFVLGRFLQVMDAALGRDHVRGYFNNHIFDNQTRGYVQSAMKDHAQTAREEIAPSGLITPADNIRQGVSKIEEILGTKVIGLRVPMGNISPFHEENDKSIIAALKDNGITYVNSWCKESANKPNSVHVQPSRYSNGVLEIPSMGKYDVHFTSPTMLFVLNYEGPFSKPDFVAHYTRLIEDASSNGTVKIPLVFHTWNMQQIDPDCKMLKEIIVTARQLGYKATSYTQMARQAK